tara:strand:+ start:4842 stop:6221 length:1380 start_codon:yes stop_codon:yes gene_type:complete
MNKILNACNAILSQNNIQCLNFIDWLHYVKRHQHFDKSYSKENFKLRIIYKTFFLYFIKILYKIFFNSKKFQPSSNINYDYIILSHKFGKSNEKDLYFGDIAKFLIKEKIKFKIYFYNHSVKSSKNDSINYASTLEKILIFIKLIKNFFKVIEFTSKKKLKKYDLRIKLKIALESLSPKTFDNYIISYNVDKIYKKKNTIKNFITTYEGFSFERAIFYSIKSRNLKTLLIGYQHAPVLKYQNTIFKDFTYNYNPDVILTSGSITKNIFNKNFKNKKILELGSNKIPINKKKILKDKKQLTILVLPEGIESECVSLYNFVFNVAQKMRKINFIVRFHPLIDLNYLKKKYPLFKIKNKNIIFSNNSLEKDISKSKFVIYRGTSAVLNCVINHVYPIYLKDHNSLTVNILYAQKKNISEITSFKDFKEIIDNENKYKVSNFLIFFAKKYFTQINFNILKKFI